VYTPCQCKERAKHASGAPSLENLVLTSLRVGFSTVLVFRAIEKSEVDGSREFGFESSPSLCLYYESDKAETKERVENKICSGATKDLGPCDVTRGCQNLS
jgi:hypothetical protein